MMDNKYSYIDENYDRIAENIASAMQRAGREEPPELVVAIKSAQLDEIEYLCREHGIKNVGENRVQQLISRYDALRALGLKIHFIGSLQTNKVKYLIDKADLIHSLDRLELAREIDKQARRVGKVQDVLIEINSGREAQKGGVLPEELEEFCREILDFENINVLGFMTMAPKCKKNSEYLKYFCETYQLVLDIWQKKIHNISKPVLSMGMSDSYAEAIECGSDMVRIGRGMFLKNENK